MTRHTAALMVFLSSSRGELGDSSRSFLCIAKRASSLWDQVLEYTLATWTRTEDAGGTV